MANILEMTDTIESAVVKMSEGNPGAVSVLIRIMKEGDAIDPQNMLGGFGVVMSLDTHGIYGSRIWMLYKDVCRCDIVRMLALLRAVQLGIMGIDLLNSMIDGITGFRSDGYDEIVEKVKERLSQFGKNAAACV